MHRTAPLPAPGLVIATGLVTFTSTLASGFAGDCIPPVNEDCDEAIAFTSAELPYDETGLLLGCANDVSDAPYWDVFFRYDCTVGGEHVISMCDSELDTQLRVWANGCGFGDGDIIAVADDECPGQPPPADPRLVIDLEAGRSYWIELGTWRPNLPWGEPNLPYEFHVSLKETKCIGDIDGDGDVAFSDILEVLAAWGPCEGCPEDLDGSGAADFGDVLIILAAWGPCR